MGQNVNENRKKSFKDKNVRSEMRIFLLWWLFLATRVQSGKLRLSSA